MRRCKWVPRALGCGGLLSDLCLACCALTLFSCAHAESFDGRILHKDALSVRLGPVPAQWQPLRIQGADVAYRDDAREGSAMFDVRCNRRDDDAPLAALTVTLVLGTTERQIASEETEPFDGREALHTRMRAKLDGVPMEYDLYVMKKDGCVYDLVYVAPPTLFPEGVADFERFARGLHAESRSVDVGGAPAASTSDR